MIRQAEALLKKIRQSLPGDRVRMNERGLKTLAMEGRRVVREIDYNSRQAVILQYRLLSEILQKNKDTEYGKKYDFGQIHTVEEYRKKVPLAYYSDYEPYITQMMKGTKNLLSADDPVYFAMSAGSIGVPKYIPVAREEMMKYARYGVGMAFGVADEYYRNTTGRGVPAGPGLNAIEVKVVETESGVGRGTISGTVLSSVKNHVPWLLSSPWEIVNPDAEMDMKYLKTRFALERRDLTFMDSAFLTGLVDLMDYIRENYEMLCRDIYHGRINPEVKVPEKVRSVLEKECHPDKERARELMREFRRGFDDPVIPRIWPKMSWIGGIGTGSFFSYAKRMRQYSGKSIPFNNVCYAASESFMAAARHMGDESFVLIPDGGFYEFIPVRREDDTKTLTIEELTVGEDYEIIVTNLSGLYRYRLEDVVRITGYYNETPLLRFIYRKNQLLSMTGEKTNGEAMQWAIDQFSMETGIAVSDFSVFPDTEASPGRYVLLVEPEEIVPKEKVPWCRDVLERMLSQANPSYGEKVRRGDLGPMDLVFLQQETYMLYRDMMIMRGFSANQLKPPRVIDTPMKEHFFFALKEEYGRKS